MQAPSNFDAGFVEKQRQYLARLRVGLVSAAQRDEADEADIKLEDAGGGEDDPQKLASLELKGNLVVRGITRLDRVDRALKKIEEGTYGLSDVSGQAIPRERLEAVPEAICTVAEESTIEQMIGRARDGEL